MDLLHYPGAGDTKTYLEDRLQREQQAALEQARLMSNAQTSLGTGEPQTSVEGKDVEERAKNDALKAAVENKARKDAMKAVMAGQGKGG